MSGESTRKRRPEELKISIICCVTALALQFTLPSLLFVFSGLVTHQPRPLAGIFPALHWLSLFIAGLSPLKGLLDVGPSATGQPTLLDSQKINCIKPDN